MSGTRVGPILTEFPLNILLLNIFSVQSCLLYFNLTIHTVRCVFNITKKLLYYVVTNKSSQIMNCRDSGIIVGPTFDSLYRHGVQNVNVCYTNVVLLYK